MSKRALFHTKNAYSLYRLLSIATMSYISFSLNLFFFLPHYFLLCLSCDTCFSELFRYENEPALMKYVKIAAMLPKKCARDVAMRCKWMVSTRHVTVRFYFSDTWNLLFLGHLPLTFIHLSMFVSFVNGRYLCLIHEVSK